jgi:tetratricopeptide (TPR) repeat protein
MIILALALLAQPADRPAGEIARLRAAVVSATDAVEGDSVARVQRRWQALAGRDSAALLGLATLARLTYDYPAAERIYRLFQTRTAGSPSAAHLYATLGLGLSEAARMRFVPAIATLTRALREAETLGDSRAAVEAKLSLGALIARTVGLDSAQAILAAAHAGVPQADTALVARTRCAFGSLLRNRQLQRADSLVREGLRLALSTGNRRTIGACYVANGQVAEARGSQMEAGTRFETATTYFRDARDHHALASANQWISYSAAQFAANFWLARDYALLAIDGGRRTGNSTAEAWARLNLAQLGVRMGDVGAALAHVDTAQTLFVRLGDRIGLANLAYTRGQAALLAGRYAEARSAFRRSDSLNGLLGLRLARAGIELQVAATLRLEGRLDEAARSLVAAEDAARRDRLPGIINDAGYEHGLLALARGEWDSAIARFKAFGDRIAPASWGSRVDADVRRAEAQARAGRFDDAEASLDEGLLGIAARRFYDRYQDREGQLALLAARRYDPDPDLGLATTVALFAGSGRVASALRIAEGWRGHYLLARMLKLRGAPGADSALPLSVFVPDSADIATLPAQLPDSTALLMYVTGRGGEPSTLFSVSRSGITARALPPADSLVASIARFQATLEGGSPSKSLAGRLGRDLIAPGLAGLAASVTRLIIIPDGPFYRLPFDALLLPDGRNLVERYSVALAPSARLAARWWTAPASPAGTRAVLFGDPLIPPGARLPRLPASGAEARDVSRRTAHPDLKLRAAASEHALKRAPLASAGLLHLATHASVSDLGILTSGLTLAAGSGEDGHVGAGEIALLKLDQALVVLSGCRTVGGAVVNGEGLQGLTTPFLEAGARAIVATQWAVGDRAMAELMRDFYAELSKGAGVGDALRTTKLRALRRGAPPTIWASLALVGDSQLRPRVF